MAGEGEELQHLTQHMPHPQNCIDWEPAHMLNPINLSLATAEAAQLCRHRVQIMRHSPFATLAKCSERVDGRGPTEPRQAVAASAWASADRRNPMRTSFRTATPGCCALCH